MKVTNEHRIDTVKQLKYAEGPKMGIRRFLVIHNTAGATGLSSFEFWKSGKAHGAEAHFIIERDGTIYQVRRTDQRADHAGRSAWVDPNTGRRFEGLNSCSIGIELANAGKDAPGRDGFDWAKKQPGFKSIRARHKNGEMGDWEEYPKAQLDALLDLSRVLVKRYNLDDVVGHDDIAPDRKIDPGPAFPMKSFRVALGFDKPLAKL